LKEWFRVISGCCALLLVSGVSAQIDQYESNVDQWATAVGSDWLVYAFEKDFAQPPGAGGCLSPSGTVTISLGFDRTIEVTRSDGCAIVDGTASQPIANARIPGGGSLTLTFDPPIRAFYSYLGSVASNARVTMRLLNAGGGEIQRILSPRGGNPSSFGIGFTSVQPVTTLEFTTDEVGVGAELGTFVGLRFGETPIDRLNVSCPVDTASYPDGALCDMAFAYELRPTPIREVERDVRLLDRLAVEAQGYAFERDFPRPDPPPGALACLSEPGTVPIDVLDGAAEIRLRRLDAACPIVDSANSFAAADALINEDGRLQLNFSPPVRAFYANFGSLQAGEQITMKLFDGVGLPVGWLVTEPSEDSILSIGHGFVSPVPIMAVQLTSSESGPTLLGSFAGLAEEPTLHDQGFRCDADASYPAGALCDLAVAYDAREGAKLVASDAMAEADFGISAALDGERALVGAWEDGGAGLRAGAVYVFERQPSGEWLETAKLTASDATPGDLFGLSVALRGDRALVGAIRGDAAAFDSGAAYLFERQANGEWLEVARLSAADGAGGDRFGQSVSLSDTFAVVGASNDLHVGVLTGSAYVFERQSDGQWLEVAKLIAEGATAEDFFGSSVSLEGNRVMIGAFGANGAAMNSGAAYVFERQPDESWLEVARLDASDGAAGDYFGFWVSLDGDRALISALFDRTAAGRTGSAYVFERQADGQWLETRKLQAGDGAAEDRFGWRVSLDQDRALVGALGDGDRGNSSGSAYLFSLKADGQWSEAVKLTAADGANGDRFGGSVALGNGRALIGAYNDNDAGRDSGTVYLFENLEGPDRSVLFSDRFE